MNIFECFFHVRMRFSYCYYHYYFLHLLYDIYVIDIFSSFCKCFKPCFFEFFSN